jgi:hypothetical protein
LPNRIGIHLVTNLNQDPEMILFEGWFNKDAGFVKIEKANSVAA